MNDKNHVPLTNQTKSEGAATLACYPLFTPLLRDECLPLRGKCSTKDVSRIFEATSRCEQSGTWLRGPMQSLLSQKTTQQGNVSADRNLYSAMHKDTKAPSTIIENKRLGHALAIIKAQQNLKYVPKVKTNSENGRGDLFRVARASCCAVCVERTEIGQQGSWTVAKRMRRS
jgi:hypothetical protein